MADEKAQGLYPRLLGPAWARVHPAVRALHLTGARKVVTGTLAVEEGRHWLARRLVCWLRLPREQPAHEVRLVKTPVDEGERWERFFGETEIVTLQRLGSEGIWERVGVWEMLVSVTEQDGALVHEHQRTRLCLLGLRLPWPRRLGPRGGAVEAANDEGQVDLSVRLIAPWAGRVLSYHGTLRAEEEA